MVARCCYTVYEGREHHKTERSSCLPPELLYAVESYNSFDILHPSLCRSHARCLRKRRLRKGGHGRLWHISAFCGRGIKPESPGRVQGVLETRETVGRRDE